MANDTIDDVLITQFSDMVHVAAQQSQARLKQYVQVRPMKGENWAYDGLGAVEAREIVGRHQPVQFDSIEHTRRKIAKRRFAVTLPIDKADVRGMLLNPENGYAQAMIRAMDRQFDRVVIQAMFADVLTGQQFGSTLTYASDSGYTAIDATAGLVYEKLLEIAQNFTDNEVGNDVPEKFVLGIAGKEHTSLMGEVELISGDFTKQIVVDAGEMTKAAGFHIVKYGASVNNPMLSVSGGERTCFAMSTRAMMVGMSKEFSIEIIDRPDLYETTQVQIIGELGAVRTEGKLIQKIRTTA